MNEPVPVVFAFDDRVLRPSAVAVTSLMRAALPDTCYQIHILHPGFNTRVIRAFSELVDHSRHGIEFHRIDPRRFRGLPSGRGSWTEIVYYRFLIPEILEGCRRAVYSDIDVFFTGDLAPLMTVDMGNCPVGAVIGEVNGPDMQCHAYHSENTAEHVFMSGFLLMDLERMRQEKFTERVLSTAQRHAANLRMFDLEALNLACDRIMPLPFSYCVLESIHASARLEDAAEYPWLAKAHGRDRLEQARARPAVIHYAGGLGKPWRRPDPPDYYREALEQVPAALNRRTMRDVRKYWVARLRAAIKGTSR